MHIEKVRNIFGELSGWSRNRISHCSIEPLGAGLTNRNYVITDGCEKFVLRVTEGDPAFLDIDREREKRILDILSDRGINAPVMGYQLPQGNLLTRWIDAAPCNRKEYNSCQTIERTASLLREIHSLPSVPGEFDPWKDIERRYNRISLLDSSILPEKITYFREAASNVRTGRSSGCAEVKSLCHNDPYFSNFLYGPDKTWLLDWEFAGMGDPYFDLVSSTQVLESEAKEYFLSVYFSTDQWDRKAVLQRMENMRIVVMLWNGLWALLQSLRSDIDHDFSAMAAMIFNRLYQNLINTGVLK